MEKNNRSNERVLNSWNEENYGLTTTKTKSEYFVNNFCKYLIFFGYASVLHYYKDLYIKLIKIH